MLFPHRVQIVHEVYFSALGNTFECYLGITYTLYTALVYIRLRLLEAEVSYLLSFQFFI